MQKKLHVHCTINNCQWWTEPNLCIADKILIVSDEDAQSLSSEMDVEQTNQIVDQRGLTSMRVVAKHLFPGINTREEKEGFNSLCRGYNYSCGITSLNTFV